MQHPQILLYWNNTNLKNLEIPIEIQEICDIMRAVKVRCKPQEILIVKGIDSNGSCYYYRDVQEGL